jgi:uncharacterized protein YdeI (YjbR/CyaY-like superfamily)
VSAARDAEPGMPFPSPEAWESWLAEHGSHSKGLWVRFARKDSGVESVTHDEALDVALCYGWIDGQTRKFDDTHWDQRFTPRGPRSRWSQVNRERVLALVERGRMRPAGLAEMERAQADGRWERAYAPASRIEVPPDLAAEFEAHPAAAAFFATLDSRNRYAVLYRIHDAKKPETRARRIAQFVAMLERQEKVYP